jgi:hypothetical protein
MTLRKKRYCKLTKKSLDLILEKSLRKKLWPGRKTDFSMNELCGTHICLQSRCLLKFWAPEVARKQVPHRQPTNIRSHDTTLKLSSDLELGVCARLPYVIYTVLVFLGNIAKVSEMLKYMLAHEVVPISILVLFICNNAWILTFRRYLIFHHP